MHTGSLPGRRSSVRLDISDGEDHLSCSFGSCCCTLGCTIVKGLLTISSPHPIRPWLGQDHVDGNDTTII